MRASNLILSIIVLALTAVVVYIFYMGMIPRSDSKLNTGAGLSPVSSAEAVPVDPSYARFMDGAESLKSDFDSAVRTLAELAADTSADQFYRTSAANILAQSFSYTSLSEITDALEENSVAAQNIVTAADAPEAQRRFYDWSVSIDPNPVAQLGSLQWYMHELQNNVQLQSDERRAYLDEIDTTLEEAEALFQREAQGQSRKSLLDARTYHTLRGDVYAFRYFEEENTLDKEHAIEAYERALRIDPATGYGLWARYHLANFLRKSDGEASRERIEALLDGVIAAYAINPTITLFTILEAEKDATTVARADVVETAQFYGPLAEVLRELGWTIPDPA